MITDDWDSMLYVVCPGNKDDKIVGISINNNKSYLAISGTYYSSIALVDNCNAELIKAVFEF